MNDDVTAMTKAAEVEGRAYSAPALEKGLDILEMLCQAEAPLSMKDIAQQLGRSVGELYRMLAVLIDRKYVTQIGDSYYITTKLFPCRTTTRPRTGCSPRQCRSCRSCRAS